MRAILAAAIAATLAAATFQPAAAQEATEARRPSQMAAAPDWLPGPIVPPVPQPAVRPQRLAALSDTSPAPLIPPVPQQVTRRQWLAALSGRGPDAAAIPASRPPQPRMHRDAASERLRACLKPVARALLERIEAEFGEMRIISTCRAGARIAGTGRVSKHATGEAIDFDAGSRRREVVRWLIANHTGGGTMTYSDMSHIHIDVGMRFVALNARSGR